MARLPTGESVVARAIRLLTAFDDGGRTLTVARLAQRAGLPVPTAHRLVGQLVEAGMLERLGDHEVGLGIRVWELAALAPLLPRLREAAAQQLVEIRRVTGRHVVLAVLDGRDALVVEHLRAAGGLDGMALRTGSRIPAHATAVGLVLLAHASQGERDALFEAPLRCYTDRTPITPEDLHRMWDAARRQGWVVADGLVEPGALDIAVSVRDADDVVVAAVGLVLPAADSRPVSYVPSLRAAAAQVQRVLRGAQPDGVRADPAQASH